MVVQSHGTHSVSIRSLNTKGRESTNTAQYTLSKCIFICSLQQVQLIILVGIYHICSFLE